MWLLLLHQEKKQMVTHNKDLLMAFVYFDQSHCGYLLERDLEEILYTLGLHLSRAQVKTHTRARTHTLIQNHDHGLYLSCLFIHSLPAHYCSYLFSPGDMYTNLQLTYRHVEFLSLDKEAAEQTSGQRVLSLP